MRTLLIDNYDSFTYNLAHLLLTVGFEVVVKQPHQIGEEGLELSSFQALCLSPGPGSPASAPASVAALRAAEGSMPVLGICLGMQVIAEEYGCDVIEAGRPVHGEQGSIRHTGKHLFRGIASPTQVARYHSLAVTGESPDLSIDAVSSDGTAMALSHLRLPIFGLQFHPESFMTEYGGKMVQNFFEIVQKQVGTHV